MPVRKLKEFLDENDIKYLSIRHSPAYTAQEIAESAHVSGKNHAKSVMIDIDGSIVMAVVPANHMVNIELFERAFGFTPGTSRLATEAEFEKLFANCEVGAMPPFGGLYGMEVFEDESLEEGPEITFNAGTHAELIRMLFTDFKRLVNPRVGLFSYMP